MSAGDKSGARGSRRRRRRRPDRDDASGASAYLFSELAIDPPLEEFRRVYEKKTRSFDGEDADLKMEPYRRAFERGVAGILEVLGEDEE